MGCCSLRNFLFIESPYRIIAIVTKNFLCDQVVVLFRMYLALPMPFDFLSATMYLGPSTPIVCLLDLSHIKTIMNTLYDIEPYITYIKDPFIRKT